MLEELVYKRESISSGWSTDDTRLMKREWSDLITALTRDFDESVVLH